MGVKQAIALSISLAAAFYAVCVVASFVTFLSTPRTISTSYTWVFNLLDNKSKWEIVFGPLFFDYVYVSGFIIQHSVMKSQWVKNIIKMLHLSSIERTIYTFTSSLSLHYLIQKWMTAESVVLWQANTNESRALWWLFVLVHVIGWVIIFGGSLMLDALEMVGIKQTYNNDSNHKRPMSYTLYEMQHLYKHVRHPSFLGFTLILWCINLMTIDRLLLAIMLTMYMYIAWSTDRNDINYQKMLHKRLSVKSY